MQKKGIGMIDINQVEKLNRILPQKKALLEAITPVHKSARKEYINLMCEINKGSNKYGI